MLQLFLNFQTLLYLRHKRSINSSQRDQEVKQLDYLRNILAIPTHRLTILREFIIAHVFGVLIQRIYLQAKV